MKKKTKPRKPRDLEASKVTTFSVEERGLMQIKLKECNLFYGKMALNFDLEMSKKLHKFLGQYIKWREEK